jgi:hypothetical protein
VIVVVLFAAGSLVAWWVRRWMTQQRTNAVAATAKTNGWAFSSTDDFRCGDAPFHLLERGRRRRVSNVCSPIGPDGKPIRLFDYSFTEGSGKNSHTYTHSCYLFSGDDHFPLLTIEHESVFAGALDAIGIRDLQFESDEFNRTFRITSEDPRFASAFIDARMMQFLLTNAGPTTHISVHIHYVLLWCRRLPAGELPDLLRLGEAFRAAIPAVVRDLYPGP